MIYNCYNYNNSKLKPGDLVFFEPKNLLEGFTSAIISSSPTGRAFSHVAMIVQVDEDSIYLIDAVPVYGVRISQYENLCQTHGFFADIEISRVSLPLSDILSAIDIAINLAGHEYNDLFAPDFINSGGNISSYCSQLIQYAYNMAVQKDIFLDIKMSFKDDTGEISEYWKNYYEERSALVLQDMPGSHPASIYESEFLTCF